MKDLLLTWAALAAALRRLPGAPAEIEVPPGDTVSREDFAKILCAFAARQAGKPALYSREDALSAYPDAAKVAPGVQSAMNWAAASGFLPDGDTLSPQAPLTHAEAKELLSRYQADTATGDAAQDLPRCEDGIGKRELLAVSFGTSFHDNRVATIGAVEAALARAFPDYAVRRAFTSEVILEHIFRRDGIAMDDVPAALERARANGVEDLLVQPTHLMNGYEYGDLVAALRRYEPYFHTLRIGAPILSGDDDFSQVADAVVRATARLAGDGKTAVCCMGHGSPAAANGVYPKLQRVFAEKGYPNYFVGTVEAVPTAEDLLEMVRAGGYARVVLRPLMLVAGDHAHNDMADAQDPASWYRRFADAGLEVRCEVQGLGALPEIQALLVRHAKNAKPLSETGIAVEPNPENEAPRALPDGDYTIRVDSDATMFQVADCTLSIRSGVMEARLTLSGAGYDAVSAGSRQTADAAGRQTFTVPVARLDAPLPYAAHAVRSGKWFDRALTFRSATAKPL